MDKSKPFRMPEQPARIRLTGSGRFLPAGLPVVKGPAARRMLQAVYPENPGRDLYIPKPRLVPPSRPGDYPTVEE